VAVRVESVPERMSCIVVHLLVNDVELRAGSGEAGRSQAQGEENRDPLPNPWSSSSASSQSTTGSNSSSTTTPPTAPTAGLAGLYMDVQSSSVSLAAVPRFLCLFPLLHQMSGHCIVSELNNLRNFGDFYSELIHFLILANACANCLCNHSVISDHALHSTIVFS